MGKFIKNSKRTLKPIMAKESEEFLPFNTVQGIANETVPAYSNGDGDFFSVERHFLHDIFMGFKWQCVEFSRRWLLLRKTAVFPPIRHAADTWVDLKHIERVTDGKCFPLILHDNGSSQPPTPDSLLIYARDDHVPFGHVAVITEVGPDYIRIAEQNFIYHHWPGNYSRQIPMKIDGNGYSLQDEDQILGWMEIQDNHELEPFDETKVDLILPQYKTPLTVGNLSRRSITDHNFHGITNWLNTDEPSEKYFVELFGPELIRADTDTLPYYSVDSDMLLSIGTASNVVNRLFMEATQHVLEHDELLERFCIPKYFWPKIRESWKNEIDLSMTGRFDFAINDNQIKVYEYNADSASALFEMSIIQEKWAEAVKIERRFMSSFQLHRLLVQHWKKMKFTGARVHILIDKDEDETLTALYMQRVLKEAGIESKLCVQTNDLQWKDCKIVDSDGIAVELVWKLWMWETIISDYMAAEKENVLERRVDGEHPRLCQIFFDDSIKVIEPLWKVIPSNKAILPTLWSLFPNHPNLLETEWTLTENLKNVAYVKKPIVGRCGQNVTMYDTHGDSVLDETQGSFLDRNTIYQKLFPLPKFDGYHALVGSWIIHGLFGGFGIREDKKLITDADSPVTACGIIWR